MSGNSSKLRSYQELLNRIQEAIDSDFYLEATWITYAVIEDRVCSALEKSGGLPKDQNDKPLRMLGSKLEVLSKRMNENPLLRKYLEKDGIVDRVIHWKNKRNPLMHSLASEAKSWNSIEQEAKLVALEGKDVAWLLANAVSRFRKYKRREDKVNKTT